MDIVNYVDKNMTHSQKRYKKEGKNSKVKYPPPEQSFSLKEMLSFLL